MKSIQKNWLEGMLCFIVILAYILGVQFILKTNTEILIFILVLIPIIVTLYDMYESVFKSKYKTVFLILLSDLSLIIIIMIIRDIFSTPVDRTNGETIIARNLSMITTNLLFTSVMLIRNFLKSKRFEKVNIGEKQDEKQGHAD